jgi:glutathione S-transferase
MTATLVQIAYSPWSEKARWALDHHGVRYRKVEYLVMLGEPLLRLKLGKRGGPATVPALIDRDQVFTDSWSIARHAEAVGSGAPLFPPEAIDAIQDFDRRAERILSAGRARTTARTLESPEALKEALPPPLRILGPAGMPFAKLGARFLQRKYATDQQSLEAHRSTLEEELAELRTALAGGDHLVGDTLSYADICMGCALQFVSPIELHGARLGAATRGCWAEPELAREYADVIAWRDRLYARHRS